MPSGSIPHDTQRPRGNNRHVNRVLVDPDVAYTPGERDEVALIARAEHLNQPCNRDAELGVIGAVRIDNEYFAEISEILTSPDDFYYGEHRALWTTFLSLYERGAPIDDVHIADELGKLGLIEAAGGIANATSSDAINACSLAWRGIDYAKIVVAHANKRRIFAAQQKILAQIYDSRVDAAHALAIITQEIQPLADKLAENKRLDGGIIPLDELMRLETPEMNWPIAGILPEGLAIVGAPPKTGKSALALQLALSIASGGPALGNAMTHQGDVLYLALEDSAARMKERVERQLCGDETPKNVHVMLGSPLMLEGGLVQIESWLRRHEEAQAVIIDTLGVFRGIGSQTENGNFFSADYDDMNKLHKLAMAHHVAIIALHHLTKNTSASDPLQMLSGTAGLSAAADAVWVLSRERNQEAGELQIVGRDVMEQNIAVRFSNDLLTWQAIGDAAEVALKTGEKRIIDALTEFRRAASPSELASFTGESSAAVRQRCIRMRNAGLLTAVGTGKYWITNAHQKGL